MNTSASRRIAVLVALAVAVAALSGGGAYWYARNHVPYQEAVAAFEEAVDGLTSRNAELDEAVESLQALIDGDDEPLNPATRDAARTAVKQATAARQAIPAMPGGADDIVRAAERVEGTGDYSEQLAALAAAERALQDSIDQLKQVTCPSEAFVIERVSALTDVIGVEAVTASNDPNHNFNKEGGYTAAVYFSLDLVDRSLVQADEGYTGIVAEGNEGGGCVEVYRTAEDAETRNTYLAQFDDNPQVAAGSHEVLGTCVIRTSDYLTDAQQQAVTQEVKEQLVRLDE